MYRMSDNSSFSDIVLDFELMLFPLSWIKLFMFECNRTKTLRTKIRKILP